ncbi:MAG: GNAT family N-acetyltransferase [Candidatus Eremiobacteraeota bacterium]|nr:GNAT family N-acetyltransferase [Candidatus Eremiobacteraeota bacterium]
MSSANVVVRPGTVADVAAITTFHGWRLNGFDSYATGAAERGELLIAESGGVVSGYAMWNRSFFLRPFVSYLAVRPQSRRAGIARALLDAVEKQCRDERLFLSTNASNGPMRTLLASGGYRECGVVDELDPGDPEVFYCKDGASANRV